MDWTTACPDWADRLRAGESIIPPPIFPDEAEKALEIFKQLRIVDAPGSPTFGEACAPWVFELVASIFGSYDAESGRRLITEWFICLPKKNSKSTIAAGIMMTALILNWRQSGEFAILAPTIEVAGNSFTPARDMVQRDDDLDALMHVQGHTKTITHRESNATLKVVAADSNTVGGKKSVGTLVDELWLFGKQANAENMLREAVGGLASRPEGFVIYLTTQSDDAPAGVFKQKLQYARGVRDGTIHDPRFVPIIFEHPTEMVERKEHLLAENLALVNPNLGYSVDREFLMREYRKARESGDESFIGFMAKHGNVEIGLALKSDGWPGAEFWGQQARQMLTLESLLERCEVVDVGVDGGGLDDLLGLAVVGRDRETREWLAWCHAWAHPSVLERRKAEAPRFRDFEKAGDLTLVKQLGEDIEDLAEIVAGIHARELLDKIGMDPAGIGAIIDALVAAAVPQDKIVGVSQGWRLGGAIKTTERALAEGRLLHCGQALMAWCAGNAKIEQRANSTVVTKQASGTAKIDPLMALFNAVSLIALNPPAQKRKFQMFFAGGRPAGTNQRDPASAGFRR
ncbi:MULTISPECIES: terminase large subunit [Hydrocarboniphaga]|uniref:Putative phage terminase, large subunit n=1 Tax=Hydrocarboniphaga effusa AP103 TaxID=1172194 RepID=I7ZE62_9GAMM|nr:MULTISPECIES: terminase large subunit [Hydrocarboniphaga]EIT69997.1 putative phage terminase, large subunit [Hydrocarboniphaga effusa AP103]EIT70184.1 putative phage terminase, large subunit [Hydrocarboniphaga effusa AP103]MDZ4077186.1 terminase large subunit [Hydrocarboniphaga sp.]